MSAVEEALNRVSTAQQATVLALWENVEAGDLTESEFVEVVAAIITRGNALGYTLGAATVRSRIEALTGTPELVGVATTAHLDPDRIRGALGTVLASDLDTVMQLSRLVDNEPKQAAATGTADAISGSPKVTGWTRDLDGDPCQLCVWWSRDGRVWPSDHPMPRHTGCACTQTPVVA